MKVNVGVFAHNSRDWERIVAGDFARPPGEPDWKFVQAGLALGDLAEPLPRAQHRQPAPQPGPLRRDRRAARGEVIGRAPITG